MKYKTGEEFLNKLYTDMYKSNEVMHTKEKQDTKEEAIHKYLDRLARAHDIAATSEHNLDLLKEFYYQKYIIKELPESYVEHQKKMARERGYGDIDVDDEMKQELLKTVKEDQKKSLDTWIEYFISNDSIYPMWFKNYAFQGMIGLGIFDKEKYTFTKRTDKTTAPFIDLNREVLALVYDTLKSEIGENEVTEEYEKALKNGESFKKLYTYYLTKQNYKIKNEETAGMWIKYDQGSDYHILCDTLKGKNTGWCIAGEEVAKDYLEAGDFYIYYTKGDTLKYTEPRIAIRMEDDSIAEVRGVGPDQNVEPNMLKIADQKLDEFPDKENYQKKVHDMKLLTTIENKVNNNEQLTKEELIFLYEIEDKIEGFGYEEDPRIEEIRIFRDVKKDLAYMYDIELENIGTRIEDFENNDIYVYYGNLYSKDYYKIDKNKLKKLKLVIGNLYLNNLTNYEDLVLPAKLNGDLNLQKLKTSEGLLLPEKINGTLNLYSLENAKGIVFPEVINGYLYLPNLKSPKDLVLPKTINGSLNLNCLESAKGLILPEKLNGNLNLYNLTSSEGLVLPKIKNGSLELNNLKDIEGLKLPSILNDYLDLSSLESAKGLILPKKLNGNLYLNGLKSAESLILPAKLNGDLYLNMLTNAENLVFPKKVNGDIILERLKSAQWVVFPEEINGNLELESLLDINMLAFPKKMEGSIYLYQLNYLCNEGNLVMPETLIDNIVGGNPEFRNSIKILSSEEYSEYYDEILKKIESEKVR